MSKVGKKLIEIPQGVEVAISEKMVSIKGPKGSLEVARLNGIDVKMEDQGILCSAQDEKTQTTMNWGTMRSLIQNAIEGVTQGYVKSLELEGVGYKVSMEGTTLVLKVGFSHLVKFPAPEGITITTEGNKITVFGMEKQAVGQAAADIRKIKKPEPYLGKGIRYSGEVVRRKTGKKAGTTA